MGRSEVRRRVRQVATSLEPCILLSLAGIAVWLPPTWFLNRVVRSAMVDLPGDEGSISRASMLARRLLNASRRWPYEVRCLQRSLALTWFLRRRRIDAVLRIGFLKSERELQAHAWIEVAGHPLDDLAELFATLPAPQETTLHSWSSIQPGVTQ